MTSSQRFTLILVAALLATAACGSSTENQTKSPGELLAQVDGESEARPYDVRLDTLERTCDAPSRMGIADNVAGAVQVLEDNGRKEKAIDIMDGMIQAIPEGSERQVECADIATGLVTIMLGGSVEATPRP